MKSLEELFRLLIFENECDGDESVIYNFSDADGVRSGKSGYSFGVSQLDTKNNSQALACLSECGFTDAEIDCIINQTIDVKPFAPQLAAHADIIKKYDEAQLKYCVAGATEFVDKYHVPVVDTAALLAVADTINQYGSCGHGSASYLLALGRPVTAKDVLAMKLTWKYAQASKHNHDDTIRRYSNLMEVVSQNNVV
jgi:hypothetical protein